MSETLELRQTPLHAVHTALGAKFAEFGGWAMPLEYAAGIVKEHTAVREAVGLFDVSHMGKVMVTGPGAFAFVNSTLSNDLAKITPGRAQYTLLLDAETGGVVDDLIAYYSDAEHVLLVPNAANAAEVVARLDAAAPEGVKVVDLHEVYSIIAVQGPHADELLTALDLPVDHGYMSFAEAAWRGDADHAVVVCRSGYTGERGYELIVANSKAVEVWEALTEAGAEYGVLPCGLGARDTLRTEMGYPLHGQDLSEEISPLEGGVSWAVGWAKEEFWGRDVLARAKADGVQRQLRGLLSLGRGIPRPGMKVTSEEGAEIGLVTSGTFSPTIKKGVGLALLPKAVELDTVVGVDVRGRRELFKVVKPPFVNTAVRDA